MNPQPLIGKRAEGVKLTKMLAEDPFSETPIFAPNPEAVEETEFLKHWPPGAMLAGRVIALRETKNDNVQDRRKYACLEAVDGTKFRAYTPGQLAFQLGQLPLKAYVEITYLGKQDVEGYKQPLHQFEVDSDQAPVN